MTVTTMATTIMTTGSRFTTNSLLDCALKRESIQKRQIVRDDGEAPKHQQQAEDDQQSSTGHFQGMHVHAKALVEFQKAFDAQRSQQEGHGQSHGVNRQQQD